MCEVLVHMSQYNSTEELLYNNLLRGGSQGFVTLPPAISAHLVEMSSWGTLEARAWAWEGDAGTQARCIGVDLISSPAMPRLGFVLQLSSQPLRPVVVDSIFACILSVGPEALISGRLASVFSW
jgi:hypothetical protein